MDVTEEWKLLHVLQYLSEYMMSAADNISEIAQKMKKYSIPADLVLNADQTPISYMSVGKQTMVTHGARFVPIKGLTDKRNLTLTFAVSLTGEFFAMQIIYSGKNKASLPLGFAFAKDLSLSQNPNH